MVESDANSELVNLTRTTEHEHAVADAHLSPTPPQPGVDVFAPSLSQEIAAAAPTTAETVQPRTTQPVKETPRSPDATFRQTRLAVTAGLVILLIAVWILQKRSTSQ